MPIIVCQQGENRVLPSIVCQQDEGRVAPSMLVLELHSLLLLLLLPSLFLELLLLP